jgi:exodeoxyribonuclease VII large subunit
LRSQLHALDPQRVLERGYALVEQQDGSLVTGVAQAQSHSTVRVRLHDGSLKVQVLAASVAQEDEGMAEG